MARDKGGYLGSAAAQYQQYVDRELEISADEMRAWAKDGPREWAQRRIAELCATHRVVYKRNKQLTGITMATWWEAVEGGLRQLLHWYPQKLELNVVTDEEMGIGALPDLKSKEGKALTLAARALDEQEWDWIHNWIYTATESMTWLATMQERQGTEYGWTRQMNSYGNKLMNKVHGHELRIAGALRGKLIERQDRT